MRKPKRSEIGTPITRYNLQELTWRDLLRVILPFTAVVMMPVGYGLWRTYYGYTHFGPAAASTWGRKWFLIGGVLVTFLLFYSLRRLIRAHTWIEVYSWGLYLHYPPGKKRILQWNDIHGITSYSIKKQFLRVINRTKHYLFLYSSKYRPLLCHPHLEDRDSLKKTIKKQVYNRIRPKLQKAFQSGQIIPYGEVSISKKAFFLKNQEIPWEFVEEISVEKGIFILKLSAQKSIEIPIRNLQNLEILIHQIKTEI